MTMTETKATDSRQDDAGPIVTRGMAIAANTAMAALIDQFGLRMATTTIIAAAGAANFKAGEEQAFLSSLENAMLFSLHLSAPEQEQDQTEETANG